MDKEYYLKLRNKYLPEILRIIFILESPPASGKYFYDETGSTTEPLYNEIMKALHYKPIDKKDGLEHFKNQGFFLVDSTYKPINKMKYKERESTILSDFNNLIDDLESINGIESQLILIKANICRLLEEKLKLKGFRVLNEEIVVPFPSSGQQKRFHIEISKILELR
ncbi:hypothetical protein SAMN05920897_11925 [Alkalispirochaeta americana]|uniref:Uncharacterized protein n=1 Tax=Alkalispirochaeta americana TaxID=159291 RepID=A0A1N6WX87_9SPIO|nr:hypothetical protein [Alkalispirochaeta americana]SIQ94709.1 hypothetical protein SAMN05920897_11925 [Alkalispirochaeta americana]